MSLAKDLPPPSEEHLNIPTKERQNLLEELSAAMGNKEVAVAFWACVQVCNIDKLRELVCKARTDQGEMDVIIDDCGPLIRNWMQRRPKSEPSSVSQSQAQSLALERDDNGCVFTKKAVP